MPSRIYDNLHLIKMSVGSSHSAGISSDSQIVGWGSSAKGKLDFNDINDATDIDCAYAHTAWISNSTAKVCGNDRFGRCDQSIFSVANPVAVRTSKFHTAVLSNSGYLYTLNVYGDQSKYGSTPSRYYRKVNSNHGMFSLPDMTAHFDVCDDGTVVIASKTHIHAFREVSEEFAYKGVITSLQASDSVCVIVSDATAFCFVWDGKNGHFPLALDGEFCKFAFCGRDYVGIVKHDNTFLLKGSHFGSVQLPMGWDITNFASGDNGYAITVCDNDMNRHLVLVGNNTVNKELVIADKDFRECPRDKSASTEDHPVYKVKPLVSKNAVQEQAPILSSLESSDACCYECSSCDFKYVSKSPKCPLCGKEANG